MKGSPMRHWFVRALLTFMFAVTACLTVPGSASASQSCGSYWPNNGHVATNVDGDFYSITLSFRLNQSERDALQCTAEFLELDFVTYNVTIPADTGNYEVFSNMPDAQRDVNWHDTTFTPGVTMVQTSKLSADTAYYATVKFHTGTNGGAPETSVQFVPSHWSHSLNVIENGACKVGKLSWNGAWCVFPEVRHVFGTTLKVAPSTTSPIGPGALDFAHTA